MTWLCRLSTARLWYALSLSSEHSALHAGILIRCINKYIKDSTTSQISRQHSTALCSQPASLMHGSGGINSTVRLCKRGGMTYMSGRLLKTVTRDWRMSLSTSCGEWPRVFRVSSPSL